MYWPHRAPGLSAVGFVSVQLISRLTVLDNVIFHVLGGMDRDQARPEGAGFWPGWAWPMGGSPTP